MPGIGRFESGSVRLKKPLRAADRRRRACRPLLNRESRGSMTVEAAMVLPLFLFFLLNVLTLFEAVRLQSSLQAALQQCGEELCEYAYYMEYAAGNEGDGGDGGSAGTGMPEEIGSRIFTQAYVQGHVNASLGRDYLRRMCAGGGITYRHSRILTKDGNILLSAEYRIRPFIPVLALPSFSMQSRFYGHAWVGYRGGAASEDADGGTEAGQEQVYVARYGVVYHTDSHCIYLNPQIREVPASRLDTIRSGDGSIYHACELCHPQKSGMVLITKEGNRYHCDPSCGGIGRSVSEMTKDQAAENLRPCPICAAGGNNGAGHEH